jgi:hypothetical protein
MDRWYKTMPSQNPIVSEKIYLRNVEEHHKKLKAAKSTIDNKPPRYSGATPKRNLKKEQISAERYTDIERENRQLLEKMTKIMHEKNELSSSAIKTRQPHSLNIGYRQRELQRITSDNLAILQRLKKAEPTYSAMQWEEDRLRHEHYLRNIVVHKLPDTPSRKERASSAKSRTHPRTADHIANLERPGTGMSNSRERSVNV